MRCAVVADVCAVEVVGELWEGGKVFLKKGLRQVKVGGDPLDCNEPGIFDGLMHALEFIEVGGKAIVVCFAEYAADSLPLKYRCGLKKVKLRLSALLLTRCRTRS